MRLTKSLLKKNPHGAAYDWVVKKPDLSGLVCLVEAQ
jgi:hypothetical protein